MARLSNFEIFCTARPGTVYEKQYATVDITTGFFRWKKTRTRVIVSGPRGGPWYYLDTGEFLPYLKISALARAWHAQCDLDTKSD